MRGFERTGVVDQDVDVAAEEFGGIGDRLADLVGIAEVADGGGEVGGMVFGEVDVDGVVQFISIDVEQEDAIALVQEMASQGSPDTPPSAADDNSTRAA